MGIEEQLLTEIIRKTLQEAQAAKSQYFSQLERYGGDILGDDGEPIFAVQSAQDMLEHHVAKAYRDLGILAERLSLTKLRDDIAATRAKHKDLTNLISTDYDVELHSPPLADAWGFFDSMAAMTAGRALSGLGIFESIMEGTGRLITDRMLIPKNEAEVRREVFNVLKLCFTTVVREIPIAKATKVYKPDLGVPELMAAAEYKFIDSETEAKTAIGGIFEDMLAYQGRPDWRSFYAVFYMTAEFITRKQIEAQWRDSRVPDNWTPIVIIGPGSRQKETNAARAKPTL